MSIEVGVEIPDASLMLATPDGPRPVTSREFFKSKRVALFSVPGAFTSTCSTRHLPGFVDHAKTLRATGIDEIVCTSVNDAFVMRAWQQRDGSDAVTMLADGNGDFARALGLEIDASRYGLGLRAQRYSMIVTDGIVEQLNVETPGEFGVSSAEHLLAQLSG
jgi:glutaredoxin/glutathione-dependent peroxiredoxin